ncbi:zinc finger protein 185 isoform X49 [Brienomyrus brachyistius]|uniref:zinc finger protein 185 isoform X44 n=1 Tax=Brienomyrus brachyistius TaxID=42636 RepID=UPI0020B1F493|nr:zinc finger protein 185 isoform X44 [Brienomyrus brachyistius]XP_048883779.1 zinc finger protein 185 isoform X45 [Brienomyrus brachyistius]XP_048883781.1 zinc finger protein 185 isoform X47 [Brienomyrus brachyistius]XP_048883782.1 zinc finger protein 185 isoform X48 [Brienomyrus brachyistius]XP_048883783.1 zinc finger protein 185 isoform X49 [Brienomyrus brachyistius]
MSKEGDRQSVLRTTKVRTSLKGDSSWIQQRSEPQLEQQKSWLAEVKATPPILELSPPPSPTAASAATDPSSPTTTQAPKPSSGYLIRGVFTKTNNEKAPASNGTSAPSGTFVKKPTDSYKKIAPHIVRSGSSSSYVDDVTLSPEEQDKRTEAASNVLMSSAARQRSYVLSAAKKYESVEKPQDAGLPFVAKRVVINDDDDISHKDKGMDDMTPPVGSRQTVQSVPPSSSKLPVEPKPEITSVKTSPKDTQFVMEQKPKTEAAPAKTSSVETPKVPPAVVPAPVVSNSSVETPKVPPAVVSAPVVSTSPKESKPVVEQKPETPPVKSSSVETPKVPPAVVPAPVVSTSPKESKPVVEQKTETPPVKSSSVETPKVPPAVVPAPVVSTSSKDTKLVEMLKKPESPAVKACSAEASKAASDSSPAPTPSCSLKPLVEQKSPAINTSSVETPKVPPAVVPAPVVSSSSKDTKQVVGQKWTETSPVKASSPAKAEQAPESNKNIDNQDLISLAESGEKFLDPFPSVPESQKTQVDQKTSISLDKLADDVIPFSIKSISASESATAKEPTTTQSSTDPSPFKEPPKSTDISVMDLFDPFPVDPNKRSTTPVSPLKKTEDSFEEDLNDLCEDHENFTITVEKIEPHNPSPSSMDSSLETTSQEATPSETESKKGIVLLKEYVNTKPATGISNNDLFSGDYISSSVSSYNYSSPTSSSSTSSACTYCGLPVGSEAKITIEHLNISCHPACFKCGVCGKSMGDLLYSMFLHKGVVHCESCYAKTI